MVVDVSLNKLIQYLGEDSPVIFLESQSQKHPWSRESYLAAEPKAKISARGAQIEIEENGQKRNFDGNPWTALLQFREKYQDWLFGYLGYDLKNHLEDLDSKNTDPVQAPDMYFMVPDVILKIDHISGKSRLVKGDLPTEHKINERVVSEIPEFSLEHLSLQTSRKDYINKIKESQRRITEGEFYEINLSHQMEGKCSGNGFGLYHQMKEVGPVPFGAYLKLKNIEVCCQSPERFIRKEGSKVFSQPIKGTSQRGKSSSEDSQLRERLQQSEKEKAENLMIVDLVRNDLSHIAKKGSVRVPKLFEIESFETVHQMVSTIEAEAEENNPVAILSACFPMGSMTGAPKIRTMKTIEELEDYRRGIYSGAIGYIEPNGDFDFNVVIRTAILKNDRLYYAVGGAITSDSDPEKEWEETMIKAQALAGVNPEIRLDSLK